ncbi:MAG TPA: serine hydroxymethyltransferase [Methanoregulaceae archaeon]|jgi:glycine hydroxymethyltransferase|nr:serine hydroxymethyltransferase [Methanoregulaceae archaeon]MDD3091605.1 serine hydroxymethyltransferase [Methanoregulaceae archaeon]MDD5047494.1 serine hydroxymethyltransferase [Methanoregulaceae archaeon]MDD5684732.1 serine hydroxymethyltransferase [Methanoregulaceae archaeon]HOP67757.1 serine hydroxymethyltransferase [Methanoregulaceae archaeon]
MSHLSDTDPVIADIIEKERIRQRDGLELIASENLVSRAVLEAMGSIMTNKYAEGYPGKRYYGGCEFHDMAENQARDRLKELFGAEHANVQPHSGTQANMAVYFAFMNLGDTLMSMKLSQGGHLSHGSPVSFTGKFYRVAQYGVDEKTEMLDYGVVGEMAKREKPKILVCGASAYPRTIDFKAFQEIADDVGAYCMADIAHIAGLCATGVHPNSVNVVNFTTTTTHKTLRGPRGGAIMCNAEYGPQVDKAVFPGMQGGPLMHTITAKAVCFKEALRPSFKDYNRQVVKNARAMADVFMDEGLRVVSGGTDNHLILLDLTDLGITGLEAENVLGEAHITVNKNTIPKESRSPFVTSGLRVGTPAVTTRGMKEEQMRIIGEYICTILKDINDSSAVKKIGEEVREMATKYPLYPE